jgi:hypothetical protein
MEYNLAKIHEAKISNANQGSAMLKIVSYLEKALGKKMIKLTTEKFKNSSGSGIGVRYVFAGSLECVRFNWVQGKSSVISSVDVFTGTGRDPNFNITWGDTSLVQSLPALAKALKSPRVGTVSAGAEKEPALAEAKVEVKTHAMWKQKAEEKGLKCVTSGDDAGWTHHAVDVDGRVKGKFNKTNVMTQNHGFLQEKEIIVGKLLEAKKGEYTPASAIKDMIEKMEEGRSFNRSEFVMAYHPENAYAYDEFVEKNKEKLVISGKRISIPKGTKFKTGKATKAAPSDEAGEAGDDSYSGGGSVSVKKGGKGEEYDVEVPDEGRVSYNDSLEHLEALTHGLIKGSFNALFVAGKGGTGKTQTVEDVLSQNGLSDGQGYFKVTGSASPIGMYNALYKYRDDIILFDDCDGALESQDGRNIIKAATDTKKIRKLAWSKKSSGMFDPDSPAHQAKLAAKAEAARDDDEGADEEGGDDDEEGGDEKVPTHFTYTGQVIFISNLPLNKLDPDGALRTRAFIISIDPTPDEIVERMGQILGSIKLENGLSLSDKQRQEVLNVIKAGRRKNEASLRTLVRALNLAASGAPNWQKLVQLYA